MGRYAYVLYYDEDNRVHVRYEDGCYGPNKAETGMFPAHLLNQYSAAPIFDERHKMPNTEIQETCGKGDSYLEAKSFWGGARSNPKRPHD